MSNFQVLFLNNTFYYESKPAVPFANRLSYVTTKKYMKFTVCVATIPI